MARYITSLLAISLCLTVSMTAQVYPRLGATVMRSDSNSSLTPSKPWYLGDTARIAGGVWPNTTLLHDLGVDSLRWRYLNARTLWADSAWNKAGAFVIPDSLIVSWLATLHSLSVTNDATVGDTLWVSDIISTSNMTLGPHGTGGSALTIRNRTSAAGFPYYARILFSTTNATLAMVGNGTSAILTGVDTISRAGWSFNSTTPSHNPNTSINAWRIRSGREATAGGIPSADAYWNVFADTMDTGATTMSVVKVTPDIFQLGSSANHSRSDTSYGMVVYYPARFYTMPIIDTLTVGNILFLATGKDIGTLAVPVDTIYTEDANISGFANFSGTNTGTATCGVGDSIQVTLTGFTSSGIVVASYLSNTALTVLEIPLSVGNRQTDKFTIFGANGEQVAYMVVKK